jgi:hypothetical protein
MSAVIARCYAARVSAARWRQVPFIGLGLVYLLVAGNLLRAGCNGINHADGTGEGLIAAAIGIAGGLSLVVGGAFCALGARAHRSAPRAFRFRIVGLVLGLLPFAIYAWIRVAGG